MPGPCAAGCSTCRACPTPPNWKPDFSQFELVSEVERRISLFGHDGKIKLLGFVNRGRMGSYNDAVALAPGDRHAAPIPRWCASYRSRPGGSLNIEQGITDDLGFFLRASLNDGSQESYEFTDMNQSLSTGLSLKGTSWDAQGRHGGPGLRDQRAFHNAAQAYLAPAGWAC